jgi:hypothetical protein
MTTHCLIVYSSPTTGREAEYNTWYNDQHIPDVLRVSGFTGAERFKLPPTEAEPIRYVALYYMNSTDPDAALAELTKRAGTPEMVMSDAIDQAGITMTLTTAVSK